MHTGYRFGSLSSGYLKAVWPEFCGSVFGAWAAHGGSKNIQKCRGRSPPHFWMVLKPPGAAQTPKTDPKNSGQTAFRYPVQIQNPSPGHQGIAASPTGAIPLTGKRSDRSTVSSTGYYNPSSTRAENIP